MNTKVSEKFAPWLILFSAVIWGSAIVVLKNAVSGVPFLWLLGIRFITAGLVLMLIFRKRVKKLSVKVAKLAVLAGVFLGLGYLLQTWGLQFTTPGKSSFITSTYCVAVIIISTFINGKLPPAKSVIGGVLCIIGVGLISLNEALTISKGDLLTILGVFMYAGQIITISAAVSDSDPVAVSAIEFTTAGLVNLIPAIILQNPPTVITKGDILNFLYLTVVSTMIGTVMQAMGEKYTEPTTTGILMALEAPFGIIFSVMFGYETITPRILIGFIIIFAGVMISTVKLARKN